MGIHDRDYMKRRRDDDDGDGGSSGLGADEALAGWLHRNRKLLKWLGIAIATLLVIGFIMALATTRP